MAADYKLCPKCNNALDKTETKCPYCGNNVMFDGFGTNNIKIENKETITKDKKAWWCSGCIWCILYIILFLIIAVIVISFE